MKIVDRILSFKVSVHIPLEFRLKIGKINDLENPRLSDTCAKFQADPFSARHWPVRYYFPV